jgi:hypothetical protein
VQPAGLNNRPVGIRRALTAVRFIVRLQMGARGWARHDKVRQRLADCVDDMEREDRIRTKRDEWRTRSRGGDGLGLVAR